MTEAEIAGCVIACEIIGVGTEYMVAVIAPVIVLGIIGDVSSVLEYRPGKFFSIMTNVVVSGKPVFQVGCSICSSCCPVVF